jgi:hypothetical protein
MGGLNGGVPDRTSCGTRSKEVRPVRGKDERHHRARWWRGADARTPSAARRGRSERRSGGGARRPAACRAPLQPLRLPGMRQRNRADSPD